MKIKLKWWWYILPTYLTLWSVSFSIWSLIDGDGMMESFGIDTGGASEFIMLNSASRYLAIATGMVLGIWVFRTFHSIILALYIRLTMDLLDVYSGIKAGVIDGFSGLIQSAVMFLLPNLIAVYLLIRFERKSKK